MNEEQLQALEALEGMEGFDGAMLDSGLIETAQIIGMVSNFTSLAFYLLSSWGLYTLAKKMNLKRSWMSWIPVLQYYPMAQAGSKSVVTHYIYPLFGIIGASIFMAISAMFGMIGGIIGAIAMFAAIIYAIMKVVQVYSGISKIQEDEVEQQLVYSL